MKSSRRIILTTIGSLGDLHPIIALALELKRRGHQTTIATTEFYRKKIEEIGIKFFPIRPNLSPEDPVLMRRIMDSKKGAEFLVRKLLLPQLPEMYEDLEKIINDGDFIISGEFVFATKILAEKYNLRWAMTILQPSSFCSAYDLPALESNPQRLNLLNMAIRKELKTTQIAKNQIENSTTN